MSRLSKRRIQAALTRATSLLGYTELRPQQARVLELFLKGRDVFVSLPTGSGKSLCYCLLPKVFDVLRGVETVDMQSIVVVVSPLIALMKDQVRQMVERDVSAVYVGDADNRTEIEVCEGKFQLVYLSPEALLTNPTWRDMLQSPVYQGNLVAFVVDEAHCVKKWGETFRKEFSNLGDVRSLIPESVHVMALTATATKSTRQDVVKVLRMVHPGVVSISPNRPNIKYAVNISTSSLEETFAPLVEELRRRRKAMDRTIIFCRTYDQCSSIYMFMADRLKGEMMEPIGVCRDLPQFRMLDMFTACTHPTVKESILLSLPQSDGTLRVIVATIAFGMGLDCPNIRRVIHWGPSSDVESYLQETGRAGRDGLSSKAILFYTNTDLGQIKDESIKDYCKNRTSCRRQVLLKDFDTSDNNTCDTEFLCRCCDICEMKCTCSSCK